MAAGIPATVGAQTPKEDVIGLLMLAAEVEHALMVQYLYAADSLESTAARTVAQIAVEEMGHLITVQNLLLAIGGATAEGLPAIVHLGRDRLRRTSDRNPLTFALEKISHLTLAKFVVVERPYEIADAALRLRMEALEAEAAHAGADPHPIYGLYAAIRWIFQETDDGGGDLGLTTELGLVRGWHLQATDFADSAIIDRFMSTATEWPPAAGMIVAPVRDRASALAAIDAITAQGEGLPGTAHSHFAKYLDLLDRFDAGALRVKERPRTPYVQEQPVPEDPHPTPITNEYTRLWARLFNVQYELLLVDIAWAISQPQGSDARSTMIAFTVDTMRMVTRVLGRDLTQRVANNKYPLTAGPTYGLADEAMPKSIAGFRARYFTLLAQQGTLFAALRQAPEFPDDPRGAVRLSQIEDLNAVRSPYLP